MANPNLQLLTDAAKLLEPILGELVFVGGCATALLITDKDDARCDAAGRENSRIFEHVVSTRDGSRG
jgi:hypothetical protein